MGLPWPRSAARSTEVLVTLATIYDPPRPARAIQRDAVTTLAGSLERIGLRTPISVRAAERIRDGAPAPAWEIVTGRHRVAAARSLGWLEIEAVVTEGTETDARLWEIAENLHRADLTTLERSEHIAEWVRLTGEKAKAQSAPSGHTGGRADRGINAAVRDLGLDRTDAQRAVRVANLSPEAKDAAREAGLDNHRAALLSAARESSVQGQVTEIRRIAETKAVKPAPSPLNDIETEEQWMTAIMRVWNRGAKEWRERFVSTVDAPVFDSRGQAA